MPVELLPTAAPPLDYYLLGRGPGGLLVEEFVTAPDHTVLAIDSAGWTGSDPGWWSTAEFCRRMRVDRELRAQVRPVSRAGAETAFRRLSGGPLPGEAELRAEFRDRHDLAVTAPLALGPAGPPAGYHSRRMYRLLFAGELGPAAVAGLAAGWGLTATSDARVLGVARRDLAGDRVSWELRRVGAAHAWAVDVTALLIGPADSTIGPLLHGLRAEARFAGLVPALVERFA
ncbi:hypothetical protein AB0M43_25975 [Longispora sp. NPDC051575]|uniref:hypothetical protein n=1 Tax=Longispora sp. NPDC051575 TaxID=3154943 RepID=UPI003446A44E